MYKVIFGCLGVYPSRYLVERSGPEATALENYINNDGRMYLEGSAVWYIDPVFFTAHNFGPLFGINGNNFSSDDMGPVTGESGTFTEGMYFTYKDPEIGLYDHLIPTGTGFLIFSDVGGSGYMCGIANDASIYQTVGTSFDLGNLRDTTGVSTRAALLDSIMHFFGINLVGVGEITKNDVANPKLCIYPNPFSKITNISFQIKTNTNANLSIYDATGRLIRSFNLQPEINNLKYEVSWNGHDNSDEQLPNGIYFVKLATKDFEELEKIIILK